MATNFAKMFIFLLCLVLLSTSALAERTVTFDVYEATIDANRNFIPSTTPINGVDAYAFVCADADCTSYTSQLTSESSNSNSLTITYPTTLQNVNGYAHIFADDNADYVTWAQRANFSGTDATDPQGPYNVYLSKVEACRSPIDSFVVINDATPNQPVQFDVSTSLDATVWSALKFGGPIGFEAPQIPQNYEVETDITLEILDQNGNVLHADVDTLEVDFSDAARVMFEWTPDQVGRYHARVTTTVPDSKCISDVPAEASKDFSVIGETVDLCYSLVNSLSTQPLDQKANEPVTISFETLSNYFDDLGELHPLDTSVNITIQKDGFFDEINAVVESAGIDNFESVIVPYSFPEAGLYNVAIDARPLSCPVNDRTWDAETIEYLVEVGDIVDPNTAPTLSAQDLFYDEFDGVQNNIFNLESFAADPDQDVATLSYELTSQTNTDAVTCSIDADHNLDCTVLAPGQSVLNIKVTDDEGEFGIDLITVTVNNIPECRDGLDNDGDGLTDLADQGCSSEDDDNESDGTSQCQDGIDNDGDQLTDFPADPGCDTPQDNIESDGTSQCQDGMDNDGDNVIDMQDPGCTHPTDDDESDATTQCQDGTDNDGDGLTDFPQDPGCASPEDNVESDGTSQCQDGVDNDGDGLTDFPQDPGCATAQDDDEYHNIPLSMEFTSTSTTALPSVHINFTCDVTGGNGPFDVTIDTGNGAGVLSLDGTSPWTVLGDDMYHVPGSYNATCSATEDDGDTVNKTITITILTPQCQDGIDNDGDQLTDLADPGCDNIFDNDESDGTTQCQDGVDNDGDDLIDLADPGCDDIFDDNEGDGTSQCQDGIDNDGDGFVDLNDLGCDNAADDDEYNNIPLSMTFTSNTSIATAPALIRYDCAVEGGNGIIDVEFRSDNGASIATFNEETPISIFDEVNYDLPAVYNPICIATDSEGDTINQTLTITIEEEFIDVGDLIISSVESFTGNSFYLVQENDTIQVNITDVILFQDVFVNNTFAITDLNNVSVHSEITNQGISTLVYVDDIFADDEELFLSDLVFDSLGEGTYEVNIYATHQSGLEDTFTYFINVVNNTLAQCEDGLDNDNDGFTDLADPGCENATDDNEYNNLVPILSLTANNTQGIVPLSIQTTCTYGNADFPATLTQGFSFIGPTGGRGGAGSQTVTQAENSILDRTLTEVGTYTYTCTITDSNGDVVTDSIEVIAEEEVPLYDLSIDGAYLPGPFNGTGYSEDNLLLDNETAHIRFKTHSSFDDVLSVNVNVFIDGQLESFPENLTFYTVDHDWGINFGRALSVGEHTLQIVTDSDDAYSEIDETNNVMTFTFNVTESVIITQCQDGLDNDNDGLTDFPQDLGCDNATDDNEHNIHTGDIIIDNFNLLPTTGGILAVSQDDEFIFDLGTDFEVTFDISNTFEHLYFEDVLFYAQPIGISEEIDLDADSSDDADFDLDNLSIGTHEIRVGHEDAVAQNGQEVDEQEFSFLITIVEPYVAQCNDGLDNDNDGLTDFPADPGCENATDDNEYNDVGEIIIEEVQTRINDTWINVEENSTLRVPLSLEELWQDVSVRNTFEQTDLEDVEVISYIFSEGLDTGIDTEDIWSTENEVFVSDFEPLGLSIGTYQIDVLANHESGLEDTFIYFIEVYDDVPVYQCSDGLDNDGDGFTDLADPGCDSATDDDEGGPEFDLSVEVKLLQNESHLENTTASEIVFELIITNTHDEIIPSVGLYISEESPDQQGEELEIRDIQPGISVTRSLPQYLEPGYYFISYEIDSEERYLETDEGNNLAALEFEIRGLQCNDGLDNDNDGLTDFPNDPGCDSATDNSEANTHSGDLVFDSIVLKPSVGAEVLIQNNSVVQYTQGTDFELAFVVRNMFDHLNFEDVDVGLDPIGIHAEEDVNAQETFEEDFDINNLPVGTHNFVLDREDAVAKNGQYVEEEEVFFTIVIEAYVPFACEDGIDNDADGLTDLQDPGCTDATDDSEDNDFDLFIDSGYLFNSEPIYDDEHVTVRFETHRIPADHVDAYVDVDVTVDGIDVGITQLPFDAETKDWGIGGLGPFSAGTHTLQIITDSNNLYAESNEANNVFTFTFETISSVTQCNDGLDNDGDGVTDLADPGCENERDNDESDGTTQCQDTIDNDGDGLTDMLDPGCENPQDDDESDGTTQCQDGLDNDNDGLVDLADPGCENPLDDNEGNIIFLNTPTNSGFIGVAYLFDLNTDPSDVTFAKVSGPSNLNIDSVTGLITWTPQSGDLGNNKVTIRADRGGLSATKTFTITVFQDPNKEKSRTVEGLDIMRVNFVSGEHIRAGEALGLSFALENNGDVSYDDLKISVTIYDLGITRSVGSFDLNTNDEVTKTLLLDIPYYALPGEYPIRITVSGDGVNKRVVHRYFDVR